jgi:hypothetical protein
VNEDEGRVERKASYRIKLFKEVNRESSAPAADPASARSPRVEWDRRQSVRVAGRAVGRGAGAL